MLQHCTNSIKKIKLSSYGRVLLFTLVTLFSISRAHASDLVISPSTGTYQVGKNFSVSIVLTNNQEAINAVSAVATFSSDTLDVVSISKSNSILTMWAEEPTFSNSSSKITMDGIVLNPGFSGSQGKVLTITFRAKKKGTGNVLLNAGSILANDGGATDIIGRLGSGTFLIVDPPAANEIKGLDTAGNENGDATPNITSASYPDSTKWYSTRDAIFSWKLPNTVTAVRTVYSNKEASIPNKTYTPPISEKAFTVDSDGIFYMYAQFKDASGWGDVSRYTFQIDTVKPVIDEVSMVNGPVTRSLTPSIRVLAHDDLSGLGTVVIRVDNNATTSYTITSDNVYKLTPQFSGKHTALVSVYDKAGNKTDTTIEYTIDTLQAPIIDNYTKRIEYGSPVTITGSTYPNTITEITLTDSDNEIYKQTTTSNESGAFSLVWGSKLIAGVYEMKARVIDPSGALSPQTEVKTITIENIPLIRFGVFIMNWLSLILLCIVSVICVLATLWYAFLQFRRFRRKIKRALREVEDTLLVNVTSLRKDVEEFQTILIKAEKKRELTKEEKAILKKFKKHLEITEYEIEDKLKQI